MSTDHTNRVAVITGASSGIGEATARALAARDHRLALLARRSERIQALAAELDNGTIAITADVTDRDSIAAAARRVGTSWVAPTFSSTTPASCCWGRSPPNSKPRSARWWKSTCWAR